MCCHITGFFIVSHVTVTCLFELNRVYFITGFTISVLGTLEASNSHVAFYLLITQDLFTNCIVICLLLAQESDFSFYMLMLTPYMDIILCLLFA